MRIKCDLQPSGCRKLDGMASAGTIGGAAARLHRTERAGVPRMQRVDSAAGMSEHTWIRWFEPDRVEGLGGSALRRGSKTAQAKAEFEYYRDTFFVPGF